MDRVSQRPQRPARANGGGSQNETFSEMASATAAKPGVVGKLLVISLIVVSIAITAFVGYALVKGVGSSSYVESDKYQAVFLSDGQIYFGKLSDVDQRWAVLEDIYYLQVQNNSQVQQAEAQQAPQVQLVKLGNEIHGPQDRMIINSDQILFFENLEDEGQVADAIARYKEDGETTDTEPVEEAPAEDAETSEN